MHRESNRNGSKDFEKKNFNNTLKCGIRVYWIIVPAHIIICVHQYPFQGVRKLPYSSRRQSTLLFGRQPAQLL